jgi:hypothetical protein
MASLPFLQSGWQIEGIRDGAAFFEALQLILTSPAYLIFEGTSIARDVRALLESAVVPALFDVAAGTIWPRPAIFHVRASTPFLDRLGELATRHAEPEICDHFHAYDDAGILLQWYDAFDLPLLVAPSIPQPSLRVFCDALGTTYTPIEG